MTGIVLKAVKNLKNDLSGHLLNVVIALLFLLFIQPVLWGACNQPQEKANEKQDPFNALKANIGYLKNRKNLSSLVRLGDSLVKTIEFPLADSVYTSNIYYYAGVCKSIGDRWDDGISLLKRSLEIKDRIDTIDENYKNALFNIGLNYGSMSDYDKQIEYTLLYNDAAEKLSGKVSVDIEDGYAVLVGAYFQSGDNENFQKYSLLALDLLKAHPDIITPDKIRDLYGSIGAGYTKFGDYAKGIIYLLQADRIQIKNNLPTGQNYINLLNSIAIAYGYLKDDNKQATYFDKGVSLAVHDTSFISLNMINTYALKLAVNDEVQKGRKILNDVVVMAARLSGTDSKLYAEMLADYANFILEYQHDVKGSLKCFSVCIDYLKRNPRDKYLRYIIMSGYAQALQSSGDDKEALNIIQQLLLNTSITTGTIDLLMNPSLDSIRPDKTSISLLNLKHKILKGIYSKSDDLKVLIAAAETSELVIKTLDILRANISEEESRLILGKRFMDSYLVTIDDYGKCYRVTGDRKYLEKAFTFAEKSKVASLLASTRELNAMQFKIPKEASDLEKSLHNKIAFFNARISHESDRDKPDDGLIDALNTDLLSVVRLRDSLVRTFEKNYPGYYTLKYNNDVPSIDEVPSIIGHKNNYINYVVSDSLIYIFLANNRYKILETVPVDSGFLEEVRLFRSLLSDPSGSTGSSKKFIDFQNCGYDLYMKLIEPVRKYFVSDNIVISPDKILSYIPFETLLMARSDNKDLLYRDLDYLMNDFNISYTYSATFMKEIVKREFGRGRDLVAFAPSYDGDIDTDSLFNRRQAGKGILRDLPDARREAEYVAEITKGKAYLFNNATESVFKKVAGNYDIIHLAMHTVLNDVNPMNSAMFFSHQKDTADEGFLYTYEVYGLPLKARMVVLSSCNTGNGILSSGEGILSLARGFLYSGCQSVVMSMWEIDDKAGTDVMEMFYDNLLKGESKGMALKSARRDYLKKASQLRSHPYYWSSLVIFGENGRLYRNYNPLLITASCIIVLIILAFLYFRKRKYS